MKRHWDHCPSCGRELDTGWECNGCGLDWMAWAYPWSRRLFDWAAKFFLRR
jgi:hypothetical protein